MAAERMNDSIFTSVKKMLGLSEEYDAFDLDIITHIHSVFTILKQIGVGPDNGFMIEDNYRIIASYIVDYYRQNPVLEIADFIDSIEDEYVKQIADEIITTCLNIYPIEFHFNDELYRALLLHLRPMLNRVKYKIFIKNRFPLAGKRETM